MSKYLETLIDRKFGEFRMKKNLKNSIFIKTIIKVATSLKHTLFLKLKVISSRNSKVKNKVMQLFYTNF